ncbi:TOX high mobility group box family member 2, partial [Varanus komodoensis]
MTGTCRDDGHNHSYDEGGREITVLGCRPAELFQVVHGLIHSGPKKDPVSPSMAHCDDFAQHFKEKIAQIRHELDSTSDSDPLGEVPMTPSGQILMDEFQLLQPDDVDKVLGQEVVIRLVLKKVSLDPEMAANYRPVANISFLGKVLERVVVGQLQALLDETGYLDPFQSGLRPGYGTESALVMMTCAERDRGRDRESASLLVLLDLSVTFDTIDHGIFLDRLAGLGVGGTAWQWFRSYLDGRFQKVVLADFGSVPWQLCHGVLQGSILSPLLFNIYMKLLETYNGQNENNEDYEIPPITPPNLPDPSLLHLVDHETGYHSLCHSLPPNSLIPAYSYQNMDLPAIMVSNMLSQDGHLLSSQLPTIQEMVHSDATSYESNHQVPLINRPGMLTGHMSALSQSQLISQMGLRSGVTHGSPSPPGSKSATPSPSSSTQEEETESHYKVTGEKRPLTDLGKKPKNQKKKKKKDPNEPQKPVSAYALFFRDTQAAIKGQNPNATFGDVSKIVASMWDSLGEEQKQ